MKNHKYVLLLLSMMIDAAFASELPEDNALVALSQYQGVSGEFVQRVLDANGETITRTSGQFAIRKPSLLRWHITQPDRQLIIVNETDLWQFDQDLHTVIRRPAPDQETLPLQLLTAEPEQLAAAYTLTPTAQGVRLTARSANPYFVSLEVGRWLDQGTSLIIEDSIDQRVIIELTVTDLHAPDADLFTFAPPDDVEWLEGSPNR